MRKKGREIGEYEGRKGEEMSRNVGKQADEGVRNEKGGAERKR